MNKRKIAEFTVSGNRRSSSILKSNPKTVLVKAPDGKIIKRHREKHGVIVYEP